MMENMPFPLRLLLSTTFKTFNEGPFLTKPVGELMWGYDSKLVDFLNKYLPGMLPTSGKFGLFAEVGLVTGALSTVMISFVCFFSLIDFLAFFCSIYSLTTPTPESSLSSQVKMTSGKFIWWTLGMA